MISNNDTDVNGDGDDDDSTGSDFMEKMTGTVPVVCKYCGNLPCEGETHAPSVYEYMFENTGGMQSFFANYCHTLDTNLSVNDPFRQCDIFNK